MSKQKSVRGASLRSGSAVEKGRMLEKIVEEMHQSEDLVTQTNVHLAPIHNAKGQKREIDVLVTTEVAGYPIRLAFECKNERKLTGSPAIDVFASKLEYVGIPTRNGIFVSAAGYTKGAIERANECGIQLLLYQNLTETLPDSVNQIFGSVLHLQCTIIAIFTQAQIPPGDEQALSLDDLNIFYLEHYGVTNAFHVADLLWLMWGDHTSIPDQLGIHDIPVSFADDQTAFWNSGDKKYPLTRPITIRVRVTGILFTLEGKIIGRHQLRNAQDATPKKELNQAEFGVDPESKVEVRSIHSEVELAKVIKRREAIPLSEERIRMPRIVYDNAYWPRSQRVLDALEAATIAHGNGLSSPPRSVHFKALEGTREEGFTAAGEPVASFEELEGAGLKGIVAAWEPVAPGWSLIQHTHDEAPHDE